MPFLIWQQMFFHLRVTILLDRKTFYLEHLLPLDSQFEFLNIQQCLYKYLSLQTSYVINI